MRVLVLNCGSSSLKFRVIALGGDAEAHTVARGRIERIGRDASIVFEGEGRDTLQTTDRVEDHARGTARVLDWLGRPSASTSLAYDAVGHRVVHGGPRFSAAVVIDDDVLAAIEALEALAPLHNGPSLAAIRACRLALGPRVPMVAAFDTAFHAGLPARAATYALPRDLAERHAIRRYGFHGLSYQHIVRRYADLAGIAAARVTLVALHLGSGCSAAAIANGCSVDTSMGFTPLEGLVMGTRSGDLDPALVGYLARAEGATVAEVEDWLNHRSGLHGLSGGTADMRVLLEREADDERARLAIDVFCYRARKYVGAYLATLGGADAVVFTGAMGERAPEIRRRICADMAWCGLMLDPARNAAAVDREQRISADDERIAAWVIPADEETVIARETAETLARSPGR